MSITSAEYIFIFEKKELENRLSNSSVFYGSKYETMVGNNVYNLSVGLADPISVR